MPEYRVNWRQCPHVHHEGRVLYVEANSADDARVLAKDHIERRHGITWFTIFDDITEARSLPPGRVRE